MDVQVRRAEKSDAPAVAELALRLVEQHVGYDPVRFARIATLDGMTWFYGSQTEAETARVLVAEIDKRVVGFVYLEFENTNYAELSVFSTRLHDIYVDEGARLHGAGRKLMEATVAEAREFGAAKILLSVAVKNTLARTFFQKAGFKETMVEMMLPLN